MIQSLSIRNFQSLHQVDLDLTPYTVIVGKSSSGKSALVRAIKTLTSNRRGLDFLTHGENICTLTATTENGSVTLSRGKSTDDNAYTLGENGHTPQRFTKLGAAVPAEVSQFLGIDSVNPINYAGQHDKPFMLADTASANASTLGRLTNVDVIFAAAKESNRQKLDTTKKLALRVSDLDVVKDKAKSYAPLKAQNAALAAAEEQLAAAYALQRDVERIGSLWDAYSMATAAEERLRAYAEADIPALDSVLDAHARLVKFQSTLESLQSAVGALKAAKADSDTVEQQIEALRGVYSAKLSTLGLSIAEHLTEHGSTTHGSPSGAVLIELDEASRLSADYIAKVLG